MALEILLLTDFIRFLTLAFLLVAAVKVLFMSKNAAWDGWNLFGASLALLAVTSLLGAFKQFGIYAAQAQGLLAAASGILAAVAFIMSTTLIGKRE